MENQNQLKEILKFCEVDKTFLEVLNDEEELYNYLLKVEEIYNDEIVVLEVKYFLEEYKNNNIKIKLNNKFLILECLKFTINGLWKIKKFES